MSPASRDWATYAGKPADSDLESIGAAEIRNTKLDILQREAVDHVWGVGVATDGQHNQLTMPKQAADPVYSAGFGFVYTKDVGSGVIELFYEDAAGNVIQLTTAGKINPAALGTVPLTAGGTGQITAQLSLNALFNTAALAQGDIFFFDGTNITYLAPGTSGQVLETQGGSANPQWMTLPSTSSYGASGYVTIGGFYIQWGVTSSLTSSNTQTNFPTAFPNACLAITLTGDASSPGNELGMYVTGKTTTYFTAQGKGYGGNSNNTPAYYIAIGY